MILPVCEDLMRLCQLLERGMPGSSLGHILLIPGQSCDERDEVEAVSDFVPFGGPAAWPALKSMIPSKHPVFLQNLRRPARRAQMAKK